MAKSPRKEIYPEPGSKVHFKAATIFARKIDLRKDLVIMTGGHRGQSAKCREGFLIIDKPWYPKE